MGRQTAIHEQVLNTQSTEELMGLYEDWAADYDRDVNETWGYSGPDRTLYWLQQYVEADGARILDAGCGTGLVAVALAQGGFTHIDGIDYSQAMLGGGGQKRRLPNAVTNEHERGVADCDGYLRWGDLCGYFHVCSCDTRSAERIGARYP